MAEKNDDVIEITDENGETFKVELIDILTVDDVEYAILSPLEGCDCGEDDCDCDDDYVLMKVKRDGEDYTFETIDDDDEFERVAAYIDELADEIDE